MTFIGISRTFSTIRSAQYDAIGAFWDAMAERYGRENLRGLGYGWRDGSIEYAIGLKRGSIDGANLRMELPDDGWISVEGMTDDLPQIYARIYEDGALTYEIESFDDDGNCAILYRR